MFGKVLALLLLVGVASADDFGMKFLTRVYEDCQNSNGIVPCLKRKAILFFDRAARMESIPLIDGVDVVKISDVEEVANSENDIDASLPRNLESKDEALTEMLWDRVAAFANSRTIQLSLPKMTGQELNKGVEEGRGKMKKMMGMMMMGAAMKMAAMIPVAMAGLFILAGKALIVSKIALLLAGILALKKLIAAKNSGGGGHDSHSSGWSSGGSSGGWDRRSYDDAADLVYSAYKKA
ncbi:uncharacterized protein LOC123702792 [Colias croceus]|uniref:uncharacterized protein LOC123702792 n=1 Tax=Colias crocea TaxID=72248 RepID=UPI001E27F39B|nr:uncharacterized protein LOC123702792 [Colias croceus]CAG4970443.1 unnamed protein product [Colias eurytheme]